MSPGSEKPKIAMFVSFSGEGGVERMMAHLCQGFTSLGHEVDLLLIKDRSSALNLVPAQVQVRKLGDHAASCLLGLTSYLRTQRPSVLLTSKHRANQVALIARQLAGVPTRVVARIETTLSASLARKNALRRWFWFRQMRLLYPLADRVIGVSQGVTADLQSIIGGDATRFQTIYNPVLPANFAALAGEPVEHPWLREPSVPVILGAGRPTPQKDFATLIRAFALVAAQRPCRLLILGEGPERESLKKLAVSLGLAEQVELPGFVANPFPLMARSALFVLSSAWEGFGNVLVEAMALGVPVVSTDCPSGPREILQGGELGPLVPVGDHAALAQAILARLDADPDRAALQNAARAYTIEASARAHLAALFAPKVGA